MKIIRCGALGAEIPAILDSKGVRRNISSLCDDIKGDVLTRAGLKRLKQANLDELPIISDDERIGAPVAFVSKIICVGLNFKDHAAESNLQLPEQPVIFMKATTSICGPNDTVVMPPKSEKTDWEVELGVVIGDTAKNVPLDQAMDHVAGYMVINDLSERDFQLERSGQWVKGKSYDSFGPMGPYLVTTDEITDPENLPMWLKVNGHQYQDGNSENLVFGIAELVSHISHYMTLLPGDVISTGTPAGVGLGQTPPTYLKDQDVVELGIEGLGSQRQLFVADS